MPALIIVERSRRSAAHNLRNSRSFTVTKLLKTMLAVSLFSAGAAGVVLNNTPLASAQTTKGGKAAEKPAQKDEKKPSTTGAKGSIIIKPDAKDRFRIMIKGEDGKALLMTAGNGFETEKEAREAIEEIKAILKDTKVTLEKAEPKEPAKDKEKAKDK